MVYKKFVKRNGRTFGPYFYESYRVGDKVKKRYIGTSLPQKNVIKTFANGVGNSYPTRILNNKHHLLTLVGVVFIAFLMTLLLMNGFGGLTGKAVAELNSDSLIIKLAPGEFLPASS